MARSIPMTYLGDLFLLGLDGARTALSAIISAQDMTSCR